MYRKRLVVCYSPLRNVMKGVGFDWGKYFHGPALFHVVFGMKSVKRLFIPSTHPSPSSQDTFIWGSMFGLDHLYSSSFLTIHTMGDMTRVEKIRELLVTDRRCLDFLRVCFRNPGESYNCSRCEKCMRTLYPIYLLGYGDDATTFHGDLTVSGCKKKYWSFKPSNENGILFQNEIRDLETGKE